MLIELLPTTILLQRSSAQEFEFVKGSCIECREVPPLRPGSAEREICSNRLYNLAFLAPELVKACYDGHLPHGIGLSQMLDVPLEWQGQLQVSALEPSPVRVAREAEPLAVFEPTTWGYARRRGTQDAEAGSSCAGADLLPV